MRGTPKERFEAKFYVTPSCWVWTGSVRNGYGLFGFNGKVLSAHRFSYELYIGPIADGLMVCHTCDNRRCVNPVHFFLGTNADNCADRQAKGRSVIPSNRGRLNGMAKLTDEQVRAIRADARKHALIAADFEVSKTHIKDIKRGARWMHI